MGQSTSAFGQSLDTKSMKSGSVRDNPNDDSFDLEDFDDIMEKIKLDAALEETRQSVRKQKPEEDEYKDNFLIKFFETQGDGFNWEEEQRKKKTGAAAKGGSTRIPVPPTKEELKQHQ